MGQQSLSFLSVNNELSEWPKFKINSQLLPHIVSIFNSDGIDVIRTNNKSNCNENKSNLTKKKKHFKYFSNNFQKKNGNDLWTAHKKCYISINYEYILIYCSLLVLTQSYHLQYFKNSLNFWIIFVTVYGTKLAQ